MKKIVSKNKKDWHEKMQEANWAYRTTVRTPTQMTPYSLVFGGEAVLPIELEHPSLRVAVHEKLTEEEQMKLRLAELESLEGQRLIAQQNLELYRTQMERSYNFLVQGRV